MGISVNAFGGIIDSIKRLINITGNLGSIFENIFINICSYICSLIYLVFAALGTIINICEVLFQKMAGISASPILIDGKEQDNILIGFLFSEPIMQVFIAMVFFAVFLLIVTTFIAVVKSEFSLDIKNSAKGPIFGRALKGLAMFFVTPVVTILGIFLVSGITQSLNAMFDSGVGGSMVGDVFVTAAYDANRARYNGDFYAAVIENGWNNDAGNFRSATDIDEAFRMNKSITKTSKSNINMSYFTGVLGIDEKNIQEGSYMVHVTDDMGVRYIGILDPHIFSYPDEAAGFNGKYNVLNPYTVLYYYDLVSFNYFIAIFASVMIAFALLGAVIALIKRIFDIVLLWLISPAMISQYPLDNGDAAKKCNKEMISRVVSVLASVFAFNMFFVIVPMLQNINLNITGADTSGIVGNTMLGAVIIAVLVAPIIVDMIFQLIIVCVGANVIKQASELVSKLLGVEDLIKSGMDNVKKGVAVAGAAAVGITALGKRFVGSKGDRQAARDAGDKAGDEAVEKAKAAGETNEVKLNEIRKKASKQAQKKELKDREKKYTKTAMQNFGAAFGGPLKDTIDNVYNAKKGLKEMDPDKEFKDTLKAEKLKQKAAHEMDTSDSGAAKQRQAIAARKQQLDEAANRRIITDDIEAGRRKMSSEHELSVRSGGEIYKGRLTTRAFRDWRADRKTMRKIAKEEKLSAGILAQDDDLNALIASLNAAAKDGMELSKLDEIAAQNGLRRSTNKSLKEVKYVHDKYYGAQKRKANAEIKQAEANIKTYESNLRRTKSKAKRS